MHIPVAKCYLCSDVVASHVMFIMSLWEILIAT